MFHFNAPPLKLNKTISMGIGLWGLVIIKLKGPMNITIPPIPIDSSKNIQLFLKTIFNIN